MLLTQSLYSTIRTLPLSTSLLERDLVYSLSLSNSSHINHTSSCMYKHDISTKSFSPLSDLGYHKFRTAVTPAGELHVSIVYDSNAIALSNLPTILAIEEPGEDKIEDIPDRKLASSPFPSPKLKKRVLAITTAEKNRRKSTLSIQTNLDDSHFNPNGTVVSSRDPFGSFVGTYEESILTGRLSTTPSKPFQFLADIGVLSIGKAKAHLKCPEHHSVSFSAFFYQLPEEDLPTPYVGSIDIQGGYRLPLQGQLQIVILRITIDDQESNLHKTQSVSHSIQF